MHGQARRIFGVTVSNLLLWGPGTGDCSRGLWAHGTADTLTLCNVAANNCGVGFHLEGLGGADTGVGSPWWCHLGQVLQLAAGWPFASVRRMVPCASQVVISARLGLACRRCR